MAFKFTYKKSLLSVIPFKLIHGFKKKVSLNYFFFGPAKKEIGTYLVNECGSKFSLYNMEEELGLEVSSGFKSCYDDYLSRPGLLRKYVLEIKDCIIEPVYGWGITEEKKLVFDSISNNAWIETYHPSWFSYKNNLQKAAKIPELISINILKGGDKNYWHFLHDLLGQVALAQKTIPRTVPFLISKELYEMPFFKEALLESNSLAACQWIVRDQYYKAAKVYFLQVLPNSNEQFFDAIRLLGAPSPSNSKQRKIYLKRNNNRIRFLKNSEAIEKIAIKYGFEIIDADYLSLKEQMTLFSECKQLIGIHGAGLTNIIFRQNAELHLLELLPADYIQPHYFWLSKGFGKKYSCILGTPTSIDTSFSINEEAFENKVLSL